MTDFFDVPDVPKTNYNNKSVTNYITLEENIPVKVQFLSKMDRRYRHWVPTDGKKMPIRCLEEDCPICARNAGIGWDNRKEDPNWIDKQEVFLANVVDLTLAKRCPKCDSINPKNATKCTNDDCGTMLVDVDPAPMKEVRYIEASYSCKQQLVQTAETLREQGIDTNKMPFVIKMYKGPDKKSAYTVVADPTNSVDPADYADKLYDYDKDTGIRLSHAEMVIVMNGGSFRETMKARSNKEPAKKSELDSFFETN
jgi:hypothetical protein